ncbi:hypothetical protein EW026_g3377 [Hermanssonia centrifuga]|uniref:Uncharacterized protein n=1 Tax=Hermanssonia centrifuga TaxID=98765 RepID=A0A4S4KQ11_9APHY|nr:hypothetical protein EW026_g3377 [Hermanssonia centrifuga]
MRPDDTPARSYSTPYNDRPQPESQMSTLPTGPRAMARNTGAPVQPSRNPPFNAPPNVVNMTGPPKGPDGWSATPNARSRDLPVRRNLMGLPEGPKGFEDDRGHGVDTRTETARDLGVTHYPDGPSGVAKLSGTNIVPVAKKRAFAPVSTPESTLPMMDRAWRPPRSMPPDPVERGYEPMSPTHRYHSPPPAIESTNRRMTLSAREDIALLTT